MSPKFYTAKGWLTVYALACGYLETNDTYNTGKIRIWMALDGACYAVRGFENGHDGGRLFWDCFDTLPEARKAFAARLKEYGQLRKINRRDK